MSEQSPSINSKKRGRPRKVEQSSDTPPTKTNTSKSKTPTPKKLKSSATKPKKSPKTKAKPTSTPKKSTNNNNTNNNNNNNTTSNHKSNETADKATKVETPIDVILNLPEAPVYYPTAKEFEDPLAFIDSIRHEVL